MRPKPENRMQIAAADVEAAFPTRADHERYFAELLGSAYAAQVGSGKSLAFLYLGQCDPRPTQGLVPHVAVADSGEILAACVNVVKIARSAGRISDEALGLLIGELQDVLLAGQGGGS